MMKFINKKMKNNIANGGVGADVSVRPKNAKCKIKILLIILLIVLISSGIGAYAEYKYMATDIKYTNEKSVAQALNELYGMKTNLDTLNSSINQTDATASDILSGKKAYTKNGLITGGFEYKSSSSVMANGSCNIDIGFVPSKVFIYYMDSSTGYYGSFILIGTDGEGYYNWHNASIGCEYVSANASGAWQFNKNSKIYSISGWADNCGVVNYIAIK